MKGVWSYTAGRMLRVNRFGSWGNLRHWELYLGPVTAYRWCGGAPCHLTPSRHPISLNWRKKK